MKNQFAKMSGRLLVVLGISMLIAIPMSAESRTWRVDGDHSVLKISFEGNWDQVNVAAVTGSVRLDAADPVIDISADLARDESMTFRSKRVEVVKDGTLLVKGDLSVTQIIRRVQADPAEDYSGAVPEDASARTFTREVTFRMPAFDARNPEITAQAVLGYENFPELFIAAAQASQQPLIQERDCAMTPAAEDYAGAQCEGTVIESARRAEAAGAGEDYHGFEPADPAGKVMIIALQLRLSGEPADQVVGGY